MAAALVVLHTFDEAYGHPVDDGKLNLAVAIAVFGLLLAVHRRLGRWGLSAVLGILGTNVVIQGALGHVSHIVEGNAVPLDYSGLLFTAGGVLLMWLALDVLRQSRRAERGLAPTNAGPEAR
ncbi:MAG TPA: hypothetical protein VHO95_11340 [Candidatus Dormibacteraeota bacterium]|nr:hypothetical protein [Candidatus Dormibacteraeota bacterium]